ncbi:MAG: serine hydrolase domain-containing protein, partial [Verrucomicrobiota bacterium]
KASRAELDAWMEAESVMGAQVVIGNTEEVLWIQNFGQRNVIDTGSVNARTKFCIGSCSKPVISALCMVLVQDEGLKLDREVGTWLPEFRDLKTVDGEASRAPTLRELLAHRGGIYSQKKGMSRRQTGWIRNFKLSLEESVLGIAQEPLIAKPGEEYAYSGAGYCVIGRVLEVIYKTPIDELLNEHLGQPLGFQSTSFFPDYSAPNFGTGSSNGKLNTSTPHLVRPFRFPLIGGSLYMTSTDASKFLNMILRQGVVGKKRLLSDKSFAEYMTPPFSDQPYGLGWRQVRREGELVMINHSGALASSRAIFIVNFKTGRYGALLYTLGDLEKSNTAHGAGNRFMNRTVNRL